MIDEYKAIQATNGALAMQNMDLRAGNRALHDEIKQLKREKVFGRYAVGQRVEKVKGYKFPGIVIGLAKKLDGKLLYLVECIAEGAEGMCHIFGESDLKEMNYD